MASSDQPAIKLPVYAKLAFVLLLLGLIVTLMILASSVLIPLAVAGLLSFLLLPMARRLERWGLRRTLAIIISVTFMALVVLGLFVFIGSQVASFSSDMPDIALAFEQKGGVLQAWVAETFGVSKEEQTGHLRQQMQTLNQSGSSIVLSVFSATGTFLVTLGLIPLYIFFLLYYRGRVQHFLEMLVEDKDAPVVHEITQKVSKVTAKYLTGLLIDIAILAVLGSIAYSALGIRHALLLALIAAMLNIIPYIGAFIGSILPALLALATKDSAWYAVGCVGAAALIQFLDNNFITPFVVGRSVNLNPLATILVLLIGSLIWGLAGMILFIPLLGMLKIVFDNVEALKPYGYLVSDAELGGDGNSVQPPPGEKENGAKGPVVAEDAPK